MGIEKVELTKEGYDKILAEYDQLVNVDRPRVLKDLAEARAQGDLSENADYSAAKDLQGKIEERIARLEYIKANHRIIESGSSKAVGLGSKVTISMNGKEITYTIVSSIEADPANALLSKDSPVGAAIVGKHEGDTSSYESPRGVKEIKVLKIA